MTKQRLFLVTLLLLVFTVLSLSACGDDDDDNDDASVQDDDVVDDDQAVDDDQSTDDDITDDDQTDDDADDDYVVPPVNNPEPFWPEWVLRHWVWEDESTQESALNLVDEYLERDIPVGAIIIDSPWETGYNTFEFDPNKFTDPEEMIDTLHELDVRVFLWITPNVNVDSPNYQYGFDNGYYINDGRTAEWWKGEGSFIDYNNEDGLAWWHGMMDNVLDMDIDGWKTDGSEVYAWLFLVVQTATGPISPVEYQKQYYTDFFEYTREKLGPDRVITSRPVDSYGVPFWGPAFSPRDVCVAGWVGDQDGDWTGLNAALINMYFSGEHGYVNFGSDIAGYRGNDIRETELFVRWFQLGAFSPIMEHGNPGDHYPWEYGDVVLNLYREYVILHHELLPYLYSQGAHYYDDGLSLYRPLIKSDWHHMLGDDILVAPISKAGGKKTVTFPEGDTWIYWFTGDEYQGGTQQKMNFSQEDYPVFVRKGAIIPMDLWLTPLFDGEYDFAPITAVIYPAQSGLTHVYEEGGTGADVSYEVADGMTIKLSATSRLYAFKVVGVPKPTTVEADPTGMLTEYGSLDELGAQDSGWFYDVDGNLWVKAGSAEFGIELHVD